MGKDDLVTEMQQRINDKMEIKASLQALHLKEEQLKMPEGLKWELLDGINDQCADCHAGTEEPNL